MQALTLKSLFQLCRQTGPSVLQAWSLDQRHQHHLAGRIAAPLRHFESEYAFSQDPRLTHEHIKGGGLSSWVRHVTTKCTKQRHERLLTTPPVGHL